MRGVSMFCACKVAAHVAEPSTRLGCRQQGVCQCWQGSIVADRSDTRALPAAPVTFECPISVPCVCTPGRCNLSARPEERGFVRNPASVLIFKDAYSADGTVVASDRRVAGVCACVLFAGARVCCLDGAAAMPLLWLSLRQGRLWPQCCCLVCLAACVGIPGHAHIHLFGARWLVLCFYCSAVRRYKGFSELAQTPAKCVLGCVCLVVWRRTHVWQRLYVHILAWP